jgi:phosphatidylinositol glycan class B
MGMLQKLKNENPIYFKGFVGISLLYALAAYFSSGFYHWDEYFQILEFTAFKWGKTKASDLPWEYEVAMRPWLQAALITPFKFLGPHLTVFLARLIMGQAMLWALLNWYLTTSTRFSLKSTWYFFGTFLLWFFPSLMVRYSSEAFSGLFLIIFMTIYMKDTKCPVAHTLMGVCAGLAFWSRFQVGVFLFLPLFHIVFIKRRAFPVICMILAFLGVCAINVGIDSWGYGKLTFSPYQYFYENIILKKTSRFGENAWYDYIKWLITRPTPFIGLPLIGALILFIKKNKSNLLGWSILLFFFIHQLIAHKELRFLFPMLGFVPFLLWWFFKEINLKEKFQKWFVFINALGCLSLFASQHPLEDFSKAVPKAQVQVIEGVSPDQLAGGLRARFFFSPETLFNKEESSFKFSRNVGVTRVWLKKGCNLEYTSRPFYELQTSLKTLKDKKSMWSLIKC